jgi:hypothetical protein
MSGINVANFRHFQGQLASFGRLDPAHSGYSYALKQLTGAAARLLVGKVEHLHILSLSPQGAGPEVFAAVIFRGDPTTPVMIAAEDIRVDLGSTPQLTEYLQGFHVTSLNHLAGRPDSDAVEELKFNLAANAGSPKIEPIAGGADAYFNTILGRVEPGVRREGEHLFMDLDWMGSRVAAYSNAVGNWAPHRAGTIPAGMFFADSFPVTLEGIKEALQKAKLKTVIHEEENTTILRPRGPGAVRVRRSLLSSKEQAGRVQIVDVKEFFSPGENDPFAKTESSLRIGISLGVFGKARPQAIPAAGKLIYTVRVTTDMNDLYLAVSGDTNPIHTARGAEEMGIKGGLVIPGMLSYGFTEGPLYGQAPGWNHRMPHQFKSTFAGFLQPGDTLQIIDESVYDHSNDDEPNTPPSVLKLTGFRNVVDGQGFKVLEMTAR